MSNWNCANCGKPSSQFGHYDSRIPGFSCHKLATDEKVRLITKWRAKHNLPEVEYSEELWMEYLMRGEC